MTDKNDAKGTTAPKATADIDKKKEDSNGARPKGLEGIVIGTSSISLVEGTEGRLSYRGYQIQDLAEKSSFEEVFYLLINGELPNKQQLNDFEGLMHARR
ncbi:MAG: citrate/2-methylcitrate synthase, partial [Chloroflexia bacterium]